MVKVRHQIVGAGRSLCRITGDLPGHGSLLLSVCLSWDGGLKFRNDINGLRAIAVVAVVLFHFKPNWVPGGFAGVDVFFVISGYLMTQIIFRGIGQNDFSLLGFYVARANRIVPPLAVLCFVLLVLGGFYLTPLDYKTLAEHVAASINFLSNFIYWSEAGYFDAESREKWLLHTWSLSVEWQFYLLYPLLLLAVRKCLSDRAMKTIVLLVTVAGFVFCALATYRWPSASYYLLPARVWELTLGGAAYLYPITFTTRGKKLAEGLGLLLIAVSYALISEDSYWPGYWAVFPVLGTFLVIQARRQTSFLATNIVLRRLGNWSYSIYLWHWPLVVVIYSFQLGDAYIVAGILLSLGLGFLSHRYIERIQFKKHFSSFISCIRCKPAQIIVGVTILSAVIMANDNLNRNPDLLKYSDTVKHQLYCHVDSNYSVEDLDCRLGSEAAKPVGLLWGDSFAGALDPFVMNLVGDSNSFISRTTSRCIPALSESEMLGALPDYCSLVRKQNKADIAAKDFDVVFLAGRWDGMYQSYGTEGVAAGIDAIQYSAQYAKAVYVFAQPVFYKHKVANIFLRTAISSLYPHQYERDDELAQTVNQQLQTAISELKLNNVHYVDRDALYGSNDHPDLTPDGLPYIYDRGHLTDVGSIQASENFKRTGHYQSLMSLLLD